jgi:hypothetical protein
MLVGCKRAERRGRTSSAQLGPKKKNVNSSKNGLAKIRFIEGDQVAYMPIGSPPVFYRWKIGR